ncbi:MAG: ATP synthase F1 subunit delta [Nitrospirae bacterium]|nr:ATP synthase F1 subunit delta [Nitrospirota bacterium]
MIKGAKRYAKQFLNNVDIKEVPHAIKQLEALSTLMEKEKNLKNLLVSPLFSSKEREGVIAYIAGRTGMSEKLVKFINYLVEENVIYGLKGVVKSLTALYLDMQKMAKAVVAVPAAIDKTLEEKLKAAIKGITGKDIEMEFVIDPSLIGGVRIQVGSTMYDNSIKGQLGLLRDKLIKG